MFLQHSTNPLHSYFSNVSDIHIFPTVELHYCSCTFHRHACPNHFCHCRINYQSWPRKCVCTPNYIFHIYVFPTTHILLLEFNKLAFCTSHNIHTTCFSMINCNHFTHNAHIGIVLGSHRFHTYHLLLRQLCLTFITHILTVGRTMA